MGIQRWSETPPQPRTGGARTFNNSQGLADMGGNLFASSAEAGRHKSALPRTGAGVIDGAFAGTTHVDLSRNSTNMIMPSPVFPFLPRPIV